MRALSLSSAERFVATRILMDYFNSIMSCALFSMALLKISRLEYQTLTRECIRSGPPLGAG